MRNVLRVAIMLLVTTSASQTVADTLSKDVDRQVSQVLQNMGYYSKVRWCQQDVPSKISCALAPEGTGIPRGWAVIHLNPQIWCIYKSILPERAENFQGAFDQNGRTLSASRCR